jgi:hypothetical protein
MSTYAFPFPAFLLTIAVALSGEIENPSQAVAAHRPLTFEDRVADGCR